MLPGLAVAPHSVLNTRSTLFEVIHGLGLNANLKLCLDAGDRGSVASGSQTKWLDVSGNGHDFNRGSTTSSESSDPTFNGTVGAQSSSEFYSFDSADWLRYDTTNETWMENFHKNNALFSVAGWVNGSTIPVFGTTGDPTGLGGVGAYLLSHTSSGLTFTARNGSGNAFTKTFNHGVSASWRFIGMRVDEASNTTTMIINDQESTSACTYSSPSSSAASQTMELGAYGGAEQPASSGARMASLAMWEGVALSVASLRNIREATRGKFGV
jgi:hypothetical protein